MKRCTMCKTEKALSEFNRHKGRKDGLQNMCRHCNSARSRQYYVDHHDKHRVVMRAKNAAYVQRAHEYVLRILLQSSCACGESDPLVLDFDHRDPTTKELDISHAIQNGWSPMRLEVEIGKCDIVCANCHRRRTAEQIQSWRYRALAVTGV